jgi:DNA-binding transcriptional MerR regulator
MITISQLASYAGVTVKAIRHYHKQGLLEEPSRDASGYRRYHTGHAITLVKIKTLSEAGLPLARIKQLLASDLDELAGVIIEIDLKLQEKIKELQQTRARLTRLSSSDRLFVTPAVASYLEQLRALGVSQRTVDLERDIWVLLQAVAPDAAELWSADKLDALGDAEFRALYLEYDQAFDWPATDPRLNSLAGRSRQWMAKRYGHSHNGVKIDRHPGIAQLIANSFWGASSAWRQLSRIVKSQDKRPV